MEKRKLSGIYMIKSKSDPEKFYIGSSCDLLSRKSQHLGRLKDGTSTHSFLLAHIRKYGIDDLEFLVLESCAKWQLYEKEQYWISELHPPLNVFKFATSPKTEINACDCAREDFIKENERLREQGVEVKGWLLSEEREMRIFNEYDLHTI